MPKLLQRGQFSFLKEFLNIGKRFILIWATNKIYPRLQNVNKDEPPALAIQILPQTVSGRSLKFLTLIVELTFYELLF